MVAYFRKSSKKPMAKKKTYNRKSTSYRSTTVARQVKSILARQVETKSNIVIITERSVSSLGSPVVSDVLNATTQGSSQSQRLGQKITPKFIDVRGHLHLATLAEPQFVRVLLLQCSVDEDGLTDLFESNSALIQPAAADLSAIYARINTTKYKVLGAKTLKLGPSDNYYGTQMFHMKAKLSGQLHYDIGSINPEKNKIVLVVINRRVDNDESTGTVAELTFNSKFYFTDM